MKILVTGGSGYIGSHTALQLLRAGNEVTILDHFQKDKKESLEYIQREVGKISILECELTDRKDVEKKLGNQVFDSVIHFAAYIEVGISTKEPIKFIDNNVIGSQNLFSVLFANGLTNIVFSSSAAVYGTPDKVPIKETAPIKIENPYALTKYIIEEVLKTYSQFLGINAIALRYFNPAGSYKGLIGERHQPETHLIPRLLHRFLKSDFDLTVFGTDYDTPDGTTIRDYIHIMDLADAHVNALEYLQSNKGFGIFNVGTGKGVSIKQVIETAEEVTGKKLDYNTGPRREGDSARLVADPSKINSEMGWEAKYGIKEIIESAWEWEQKRPHTDYD